jgi:hypothetical protein
MRPAEFSAHHVNPAEFAGTRKFLPGAVGNCFHFS